MDQAPHVPGCDIKDRIGDGSSATVWRAHQRSLARDVAIKVLRPELAELAEKSKRFMESARVAARLKHTNLVQIYDVGQEGASTYFVMEYVAGRSLRDALATRGKLSEAKALAIAESVAEALQNAWDQEHLAHRSVKPGNILIDEDGTVKIGDLGLIRHVDPVQESTDSATYPPDDTHYVAPEQVKGFVEPDHRSDMYSLGATLYHLVTGRAPFAATPGMSAMLKHINGQIPNPRDVVSGLSMGFSQLLTRLMMKKPEERYDSWSDVLRSIATIRKSRVLLQKTSGNSTISPPAAPAGASGKRTRTAAGAPAGAHVLGWLTVGIVWFLFAWYVCKGSWPWSP